MSVLAKWWFKEEFGFSEDKTFEEVTHTISLRKLSKGRMRAELQPQIRNQLGQNPEAG